MESTRVRHLRKFINVTCFVFAELEHPVQVIFLMRMCMPSSLVVSKTTRKADNVTVDEARWGQTTPSMCAKRVGSFFQNGAEKVCKGFWVPPYWIYLPNRPSFSRYFGKLVRAM